MGRFRNQHKKLIKMILIEISFEVLDIVSKYFLIRLEYGIPLVIQINYLNS
jgi:hypothetical protein